MAKDSCTNSFAFTDDFGLKGQRVARYEVAFRTNIGLMTSEL